MAIYVGQEPHPPLDGEIMRYRTNDETEDQLRVSVNSLLNLANEIWLSDEHVTDRVKDHDGKASES